MERLVAEIRTVRMIELELAIVIVRPIQDVFAFTTDVTHWTQTNPSNREVHLTSAGSMGQGSTFRVLTQMMGRLIESRFEVTEYEPNRLFGLRSTSGSLRLRGRYLFEPVAGGTRVHLTQTMELPWLLRPLEPVLTRLQRKRLESDIANLKRLIEE